MGEITEPFQLRNRLEDLCADMGIDPYEVAEIIIKPDEIQIRRYRLTEDGRKVADHLGQAKTYVDLFYWI